MHVINVYGWPFGTPDLWKNQNALWKDMFCHVAGLGDVPWVMAGDWNATPDQLWVLALAPRAAGWLPDVGGRQPTCFPVKGEPTEKDFFLVSHCLRGAVTDYDFLPVGVLPTHRAVKLTLRLAALREPVRTFRKPRTIPHTAEEEERPQDDRPPPWTKVETGGLGAQRAWEAWTTKAEDWLLRRAGIPQDNEEPYDKGRGAPPAIRMRMPLPIATHQQHGEVHGRAKIWTARANRYRELARAREEHRSYYGDLLSAAIAANPPRGRSQVWAQRDQKIAIGRATPEEIGVWALEAKAFADEENRRVMTARRNAWNDWVATSWTRSPCKVYAWCETERPAPILSTTDAQGNWFLSPNGVAQEAAEQWGRLWRPPPSSQEPQALPFDDLPGMPPLTGALLWDVVRHIPRAKAQGLNAWSPDDFKALPREACDDLVGLRRNFSYFLNAYSKRCFNVSS